MAVTLFYSGQYRKWNGQRVINVCKFARKARIKGLRDALADDKLSKVEVRIDNVEVRDWSHKNDDLLFPQVLARGDHRIEITITYNDLESSRVERY